MEVVGVVTVNKESHVAFGANFSSYVCIHERLYTVGGLITFPIAQYTVWCE
jgi:hypothetical protein